MSATGINQGHQLQSPDDHRMHHGHPRLGSLIKISPDLILKIISETQSQKQQRSDDNGDDNRATLLKTKLTYAIFGEILYPKSFKDDNEDFSSFEDLIDVMSFINAFKESFEKHYKESPASLTQISHAQQFVSNQLCSSSTSPSSSDRSSSSGNTNARTKATPGQILTMKKLFKLNYSTFGGNGWSLLPGEVVDDRLRRVIEGLSYESALHSFIVEDVYIVLRLLDDERDREEITKVMVTRKDEKLPRLSPGEPNFLEQYNKSPRELHKFLLNNGFNNIGSDIDRPEEGFQVIVHDCITQILWKFQQPGEFSSEFSTQRRRKQDAWEGRQHMGHKVDGGVVITKRPIVICWIETAKKDSGPNTSKCLHDTRKLLKVMKDGHDFIREKAEQYIRDQLVTFGLRISSPSVVILTLHQRLGRFYQATEEETISLPLTWLDKEDTVQVLAVIARILRLRKAIHAMAVSVSTWTQSTIDGESPKAIDWVALTVTSPRLLPTMVAGPTVDVPPLSI
ncbi:hypothetical protein FBU30_007222 [Linnemannia zychae]|nr:hypothetical protein FBU30_007222 [Linnemannia zychae]